MSGTSDQRFRSVYIVDEGRIEGDSKFYLRDDGVYFSSKADGYFDLDADVGIRLNQTTTMATGKQLNAAADGVVTKYLVGTVSDSDFTTDTNGLVAVTSGRLYIRYGGGWHYIDVDA